MTDVTGVAIRVPRPRAAGADTLSFRASPQAGVGIRSPVPAPPARNPFLHLPRRDTNTKKNRLPPVLSPYLAFLNTVSGAVMTTRVLSATDPVRNALPPTTECSPITVSPPRMDAPE